MNSIWAWLFPDTSDRAAFRFCCAYLSMLLRYFLHTYENARNVWPSQPCSPRASLWHGTVARRSRGRPHGIRPIGRITGVACPPKNDTKRRAGNTRRRPASAEAATAGLRRAPRPYEGTRAHDSCRCMRMATPIAFLPLLPAGVYGILSVLICTSRPQVSRNVFTQKLLMHRRAGIRGRKGVVADGEACYPG